MVNKRGRERDYGPLDHCIYGQLANNEHDLWSSLVFGLWTSHVGGLRAAGCLNFIGYKSYIHIFIEGNWLVFGFFSDGDKCSLEMRLYYMISICGLLKKPRR